ncbi:GNAT family N-acetyltransferase [Oleiharenicola sp. Vm1]|uniref:GNAT family N-acetyltransferase n=1 Tax=Oleiharenicola sp. Vm1 TaxID=3398393 RepID=UPI0039F5B285
MQIVPVSSAQLLARRPEFELLLADAVGHGASIGFLLPLEPGEAAAYWRGVAAQVEAGGKVLIGAFGADGSLLGCGQLALEPRANGRHRAEVQKLMVRHDARGRGLGAAIMRALEAEARRAQRSLLFLDTSVGAGGAVRFYEKLGYTLAGGIPDYARDPDGAFAANAIFYKRLPVT